MASRKARVSRAAVENISVDDRIQWAKMVKVQRPLPHTHTHHPPAHPYLSADQAPAAVSALRGAPRVRARTLSLRVCMRLASPRS